MSLEERRRPGEPALDFAGEQSDTRRSSMIMLRVTQANQAQLAMADPKANIVLGTSVLGLTMILGRLLGAGLTPSLGVLAVFILASAFFARMDGEEYKKHMLALMEEHDLIEEAIPRDIHQAGTVLYREKYRYLAYSYRLLLAGLVLALAAAGAEFALGA